MSKLLSDSNVLAMGICSLAFPDNTIVGDILATVVAYRVPGLRLGDFVMLSRDTHQDNVGILDARVYAADTLSVTWTNPSAAPVLVALADTYRLFWMRPGLPTTGGL